MRKIYTKDKRTYPFFFFFFFLQGFSHPITTNGSGAALLEYLILDTDGISWELKPTHRYLRAEITCLVFYCV